MHRGITHPFAAVRLLVLEPSRRHRTTKEHTPRSWLHPPVQFSGLSPQFVGVYQVNAAVPQGAPTGNAVPLQFQIGGLASTSQATIAVSN
jgi:hypothetical protein